MTAFEWRLSSSPVPYDVALAEMDRRVAGIENGTQPELFWLLEHPPTYTAGTSAAPDELLDTHGIPVFNAGRGGRYTYHGPGQRVIYVVSDLRTRGRDVRAHVNRLEEWVIRTLGAFGITGERRCDRIGVWVDNKGKEEKIAAIGVRVRHWIAFHGLALNVAPNLDHFKGIVPCGIADYGVTSMHALGVKPSMAEVDAEFKKQMPGVFVPQA